MAIDLRSPWGRRWVWWWLHRDIFDVPVCACCGYPNFGQRAGPFFELAYQARECIICGYPDFGTGFEDEDEPSVFRIDGVWLDEDEWLIRKLDEREDEAASEWEWEVAGCSLSEARRNYETRGVVFRPGDYGAGTWKKVTGLRRTLTRLLDKRMAEPSRWREEDGRVVEQARQEILAEFKSTDNPRR